MIAIRKVLIPAFVFILFSAISLAQVPEFNVVPDGVDRDLSAYNDHEIEFSFTNLDSSRDIYNVTLENTSPRSTTAHQRAATTASESATAFRSSKSRIVCS